jgi:signal transduction histidine kinase
VAFLAALLVAQALVFVWLAGRTAGAFPAASGARLAELVAADIRDQLEADRNADLGAHIAREYGRVVQPFVVVMADGRAFSNRDPVPPAFLQATRGRLAMMMAARPLRRRPPPPRMTARGRAEVPIGVNGELAGLVAVPPGRPAPLAALRPLGPTLALSGLALLVIGAGVAALLIFGPVRTRLRQVEDAAARIGKGDTRARAPEYGGDEVAALARSFNQMAADLEARAAALSASDQARRQLLADVSHELMTPLTAMRGYLETLAMAELRLDPPTRERYLRVVDEETRRLERIIGDLLDLARLEGGGSSLRREFVDTGALFERVAERHARDVNARGIRLTRRVEPGAAQLAGDPDRLEQALQNLAANALRHTPDGGEVRLSAEPSDGSIRIVVRDSGPGIAPEHLPLIFDRFYKVDAARATAGSGLGLSIVKAIIERHGGSITARNERGAVFEILLPIET